MQTSLINPLQKTKRKRTKRKRIKRKKGQKDKKRLAGANEPDKPSALSHAYPTSRPRPNWQTPQKKGTNASQVGIWTTINRNQGGRGSEEVWTLLYGRAAPSGKDGMTIIPKAEEFKE